MYKMGYLEEGAIITGTAKKLPKLSFSSLQVLAKHQVIISCGLPDLLQDR
jgi:hypothetical protein